jgi:hypothetical protein
MKEALSNKIEWDTRAGGYTLFHNGKPTSELTGTAGQKRVYEFLNSVDSFHFCSRMGYTGTFRKETVQRGGEYWRVYKKIDGKLYKKHVGKSDSITLGTLEAVTQQLSHYNPTERRRAKERRDAKRVQESYTKRFNVDAEQPQPEQPRKRRLEDVLRERREQVAREQQEQQAREQAERDRQAQEAAERERQEQARKRAKQEEARRRREKTDRLYEQAQEWIRQEQARQQHGATDGLTKRLDTLRTMGFDAMPSASDLKRRYRDLAMKYHPDRGGDTSMMAKVNAANDLLKKCVAA